MLPRNTALKKIPFKKNKQQGFAVLTSAVLLSIAGIIFTTNMASSQLVDNQIIGNYYRNNEAFANAESGMNFVLSQLDDVALAEALISGLNDNNPTIITSVANHYQVNVFKTHSSKITIISSGTSMDATATRDIQLEIDFFTYFPIPDAALKANKVSADETVLLSPGCGAVDDNDCLAKGNIAENTVISNPKNETFVTDPCTGGDSYLGENKISVEAIYGTHTQEDIESGFYTGDTVKVLGEGENWTSDVPKGSTVFGIDVNSAVIDNPETLFEATYGIAMDGDEDSDGTSNLQELKNYAVEIDGENCSEELQDVSDEDDVIFITGDCDIEQYYAEQSVSSENKVLTIGSADNPKLVFIEGGTFVNAPNTGSVVNGMLHFLPSALVEGNTLTNLDGSHTYSGTFDENGMLVDEHGNFLNLDGETIDEEDAVSNSDFVSIDMGGATVNGAMLSDYGCSHDGYDDSDSTGTKQHFSAHFDKLLLTTLYEKMGGDNMLTSGYRLASGTWRDF